MFRRIASAVVKDLKRVFTPGTIACIVIGTAIASFGLHNVHQRTGITEGVCYFAAFRLLGKDFLKTSALASVCLAGWFFLWERLPYLFPDLSGSPLLAAIAGALFIGVGVGLVVRKGASSGGDDALAMAISKALKCRIAAAYLFTDVTVLLLSLTYLPVHKIAFSLITVTLSSTLLDLVKSVSRESISRRLALRTAKNNDCRGREDQA